MTTLAELLRLPPAQSYDSVGRPVRPDNYDPAARRSVVPNLAAQGEDARYRQRLAPDAADKLRAMGLGALDFAQGPSGAIGVFDPAWRDRIRQSQQDHPGAAAAGAMLLPAGLAGLLTRNATKAGAAGLMSGAYQGGDWLDALSGRRFPKKDDE